MSFTPNANFLAISESGTQTLRHIVEINDDATTHKITDGIVDAVTYPVAVATISMEEVRLDPLSRRTSIGGATVLINRDWFAPTVVATRMKGKSLVIKLGFQELAEVDFLTVGNFLMEPPVPSVGGAQWLQVKCKGIESILQTAQVIGGYRGHPLEVMEQILIDSGVPTAMYDATTLDPTDAAYSEFGHYVVSDWRTGRPERLDDMILTSYQNLGAAGIIGADRGDPQEPEYALAKLLDLASMLPGSLRVSGTGVLEFVVWDVSTASDHWTTDDYSDFLQTKSGKVINQVVASTVPSMETGEHQAIYREQDDDSVSNYAYPGESERIFSFPIQHNWTSLGWGWLGTDDGTIGIGDTALNFGTMGGISGGSTVLPTPASQAAWSKVSASNPMWMLVEDEIMKCTAIVWESAANVNLALTGNDQPVIGSMTVTRAQKGTTATIHPADGGTGIAGRAFYDITTVVDHSTRILDRWNDGAPLVELKTSYSKMGTELADIITIDNDQFLHFGNDGLDSNTKFEVIGKKLLSSGIKWVLCRGNEAAADRTRTSFFDSLTHGGLSHVAQMSAMAPDSQGITLASIRDGFAVTDGGGLSADVARGYAAAGALSMQSEADTLTLQASKDHFIYAEVLNRALTIVPVTIAASPTTTTMRGALIAVVTTDATSVTNIDEAPVGRRVAESPRFGYGSRTSSTQAVAAKTWVAVDFNTYHDGGVTFASSQGTVNSNGLYRISASMELGATLADGDIIAIEVWKNGTTTAPANGTKVATWQSATGNAKPHTLQIDTGVIELDTADTFVIWVYADTATSISATAGESNLSIAKMSDGKF